MLKKLCNKCNNLLPFSCIIKTGVLICICSYIKLA